jgi:hypothetical protein
MKKVATLAASSFVIVADLRPARPVIVLMTPFYIPVPGKDDAARDHRVAVWFDEDEDERGIDVLTAILYRSPLTFSKIAAVYERKGHVTVWTQETTHVDRTVIETAATDSTVLRGDRWSAEVREIFCDWGGEQPTLKVTEYSEPHDDSAKETTADRQDSLINALDSIIPLGGVYGVTDWRYPGYAPHQERDIVEALNQLTDNKTTLTLRRDRGSRE